METQIMKIIQWLSRDLVRGSRNMDFPHQKDSISLLCRLILVLVFFFLASVCILLYLFTEIFIGRWGFNLK